MEKLSHGQSFSGFMRRGPGYTQEYFRLRVSTTNACVFPVFWTSSNSRLEFVLAGNVFAAGINSTFLTSHLPVHKPTNTLKECEKHLKHHANDTTHEKVGMLPLCTTAVIYRCDLHMRLLTARYHTFDALISTDRRTRNTTVS